MGVRVHISARLIRWPQKCACCLGRADAVYQTTHTRVTGKNVVHTDSRWWKVPYCSGCLDHMDAKARASSITAAGAYTVLILGIFLGLCVASFGSCCCGPAVFAPRSLALGIGCRALPALRWRWSVRSWRVLAWPSARIFGIGG